MTGGERKLQPPGGDAGELRLQALAEHDFDVVAVIGADGNIVFVSASAERLFGYDPEAAIGFDCFEILDDEGIGGDALHLRGDGGRRAAHRLPGDADRPGRRDLIDLELVAANHLDDPIGGIVVNIRDITERKQSRAAVREVERRQATIIESLADGVMMVDSQGVVVRVNEAFEVMFGAPPSAYDRPPSGGDPRAQPVGRDHRPSTPTETEVAPDDHPLLLSLANGRR